MAITQTFNSKVVFGGRIDPSFYRSTDALNDAVKQTGNTVSTLTRKQERLKDSIAKTKLAGRDVSKLVNDYKKIGREIEIVTKDQQELNRQLAQQQRLDRWAGRGKRMAYGATIGAAKWSASKSAGLIGTGLKWGALGSLGAAVALPATALASNAETAEKVGLARSYGVGIEKYSAWENIGKAAGLNGENIGDLTEELTNKIGELGNEKSLDPMLAQINLSKSRIGGWSREKQFDEVMNRISKLKDEKQAASLADQLMSGEANKIMTYMRITGKNWSETMEDAKKSNLLSKEGAEGATKAHFAMTNLWSSVSSGFADVVGKVSGDLAPEIDNMRNKFISWFNDNEGSIVDTIKKWVSPEKLEWLWQTIVDFGNGVAQVSKIIWAAAKKLEWLLPDDTGNKSVIDEYLKNGNSYEGAKSLAKEYDLESWFNEKYSVKKEQDAATDINNTLLPLNFKSLPQPINKFEININATPGTDTQAVGQAALDGISRAQQLSRNGNAGSMWDQPFAIGG